MKIHNNMRVAGKPVRKTEQSRSDGVFGQVLGAQIDRVEGVEQPQPNASDTGSKQAWRSLEESVALLDQALQCIEHGEQPSETLIDQIDQMRSQLRQHVASGGGTPELSQADTLLAVEAERMRSLQD